MKLFVLFLLVVSASDVVAAPKTKKRTTKIQGSSDASAIGNGDANVNGGADSVDGWIIQKDASGRLVKVPRKQSFRFGGSNVDGAVTRPAESSLATRAGPPETSLIPVRKSFRREFMDSAGAGTATVGSKR